MFINQFAIKTPSFLAKSIICLIEDSWGKIKSNLETCKGMDSNFEEI